MAWQTSREQFATWFLVYNLTPKQIGEKFAGNPMPEDCVILLLEMWGFIPHPQKPSDIPTQ